MDLCSAEIWYMITFISNLCMKKMESSKLSLCLQEHTHPYCFLMILLTFPVHQKTVLAKLWDPGNIYFVHKAKQPQPWIVYGWAVSFAYGGDFSKIICVRVEWQTCSRVLTVWNLSVQWRTSAMVHVSGNLQHATCFKPLLSTRLSLRKWLTRLLKRLISFERFIFYLNTDNSFYI